MDKGPTTRFSTVKEVADMLRVSEMTVRRLIEAGELRANRFAGSIRIPTAAVWEFVRGTEITPGNYAQAPVVLSERTRLKAL